MAVNEHTVEIRYGSDFSSNYFNFLGMPTPYVSRSQEMVYVGQKWCQLTTLTLNGQIIGSEPVAGENLNTISILNDRAKILSGFNESFNKLAIYENGTSYETFEGCMVKNIDFSAANFGAQDYTISLECFNSNEFLGTFGILSPTDSVSFSDNEDGTVNISHSISAQGFTTNTSSSSEIAITNAKNFVESRTGYSVDKISPRFIGGINDSNLVLTSINKSINRVEGSYQCSLEYIVQTGAIGDVAITPGYINIIDTSVTSGAGSDYVTVDVNFSTQGDKYASVTGIRNNKATTGTLFSVATGAISGDLCQLPINLSVSDTAETDKTIKVSASFDNNLIYSDLGTGVFLDYTVSVDTDDITDTASVNIEGEIRARGNNREQFNLKSGYYHSHIKTGLFSLANEIYTGVNYNNLYGNVAWALNPSPTSSNVNFDEIKGTVKCSASYDNADYKENYKIFNYKIDVIPSLKQYATKPSCNENGLYGLFDLNTQTREKLTLNINSQATLASYQESNFDFLNGMHIYSDDLRLSILGAGVNEDQVIDSETSTAPKLTSVAGTQQLFDSSLSQTYTWENPTSFYQ
jgi:hypothetical protein